MSGGALDGSAPGAGSVVGARGKVCPVCGGSMRAGEATIP